MSINYQMTYPKLSVIYSPNGGPRIIPIPYENPICARSLVLPVSLEELVIIICEPKKNTIEMELNKLKESKFYIYFTWDAFQF